MTQQSIDTDPEFSSNRQNAQILCLAFRLLTVIQDAEYIGDAKAALDVAKALCESPRKHDENVDFAARMEDTLQQITRHGIPALAL